MNLMNSFCWTMMLFEKLFHQLVNEFKPKMLLAGYSAYPRHYDYKEMKSIADEVGAILMADISHIAGLVGAEVAPDPFQYCDVVTTTTHKTLSGPRRAICFEKKNVNGIDLIAKINEATFPGLMGGPHNHTIAGIAVALKQALTPDFKRYQQSIQENSIHFAEELKKLGFNLLTGGTDNHMIMIDLRNKGIDGYQASEFMDIINVSINKNTIQGDLKAVKPSGIRVGTPPLTTRGADKNTFTKIAHLLEESLIHCKSFTHHESIKDFKKAVKEAALSDPKIIEFKNRAKEISSSLIQIN